MQEFEHFRHPYDKPPQPEDCSYLIQWFYESGMCLSGGMGGAVSLTWLEIQSFDSASAYGMTAWEKRTVKTLSERYCSGLTKHANPKAPPPYDPEDGEFRTHQREQQELRRLRAERRKNLKLD